MYSGAKRTVDPDECPFEDGATCRAYRHGVEVGRADGIRLDVSAGDLRAVSYVVCAGDKDAARRVFDAIVKAREEV